MEQMTMKAARINIGLTQAEAADKLHVTRKTLGNWENGITHPTADKINSICTLYGVNYDSLLICPKITL